MSSLYTRAGKRALDLVASSAALVVLLPLLAITALLVRAYDGGPAVFRQVRSGRHGRAFVLLKFRSMPVDSAVLPSDQAQGLRLTPIGGFIRRTNIDELPQLLNVLVGDMSLVGPRPALPAQTHLLALRARNGAIHCKPGLTGLAQVCSFDGMSTEAKAAFDGEYASNVSLVLDLSIVLRTFLYLLRRPPVY